MPRDPSADIGPRLVLGLLHAGHRGGCDLPMVLTTDPRGHWVWPRELCAGGGSPQSSKASPSW